MIIYCDVNGTLVGNVAGHSNEACADALLALKDGGHDVRICSAAPGPDQVDKGRVLSGDLAGALVIDDDLHILSHAVRRGAIAVPAPRLLELAQVLVGR